jgi:hypothetical protein
MNADGSLSGLLAGYPPWFPICRGWVEASGSVIEQLTWVQLPGVWYALKRNADYSPERRHWGKDAHLRPPCASTPSPLLVRPRAAASRVCCSAADESAWQPELTLANSRSPAGFPPAPDWRKTTGFCVLRADAAAGSRVLSVRRDEACMLVWRFRLPASVLQPSSTVQSLARSPGFGAVGGSWIAWE